MKAVSAVRPVATVASLKRQAKHLKKAENIQLSAALNRVAEQNGFHNYTHALRVLSASSGVPPATAVLHEQFITVYWLEGREAGRETLRFTLQKPWHEVISQNHLRHLRGLFKFKVAAPDHFVRNEVLRGQEAARSRALMAARTLQFVVTTDLVPASTKLERRAHPQGDRGAKVPGSDHVTYWTKRQTDQVVIADEPYSHAFEGDAARKRKEWIQENGYQMAQPTWAGMWNPPNARLCLYSPPQHGLPLAPIVNALESSPAPVCLDGWQGESGSYWPTFVSPAALKSGKPREVRPKDPFSFGIPSRNAVDYGSAMSHGRRPAGKMPLDAHREIGDILRVACGRSERRKLVQKQLSFVRSELDSWIEREFTAEELPAQDFNAVYYGSGEFYSNERKLSADEAAEMVRNLQRVVELLEKHYPECAPRRDLVKRLQKTQKRLRAWAGAASHA